MTLNWPKIVSDALGGDRVDDSMDGDSKSLGG